MAIQLSLNHSDLLLPDFYHYKSVYPPAELVKFATLCSNNVIMLFIEGQSGALPIIHPKRLKADLEKQITDHAAIENVKVTKQGKIILLTQSIDIAFQMLQLIVNVPVIPRVQYNSITSRFLLYGIPIDVSCEELTDKVIYNGVHV